MEPIIIFDPYNKYVNQRNDEASDVSELERFNRSIDELFSKVHELEQGVNLVEQFYMTAENSQPDNPKSSSIMKDKVKKKYLTNIEKEQQNASQSEAAAEKRMQQLIHQFAGIFYQITQHKWAWPFMEPVDVVRLCLNDYYEVKLNAISKSYQLEQPTFTVSYHSSLIVICHFFPLIAGFKNAMKYNDERDDVHVMARTLLEKFEEKWLQLLPKVAEEEKRREKVKVAAQSAIELAQEVSHANMARNLNNELSDVDMQLEKLRNIVVQKCRRTSVEEKKKLGAALTRLSPENLTRALEIVADDNPSFQATAQVVDLDMDTQSESTLWRLRVFVKDALKDMGTNAMGMGGSNNDENKDNIKINNKKSKNTAATATNNNKRRREICDAITKTSAKKARKTSVIS
ncbi:bromodomain-containing protein, putative [Ricinus communis]|uniref:Bromodomain-containing protein, putative n=1 Tax=Ricinus communis TaxID=3988 RepID=B9T393_RICCO|nr:bromodomain-containing protein, putative [Ricinus communis]|eukprot:XP_002532712.1 transcription factor GTE1 [Ricinus communis]